ncbi:hypothetical protein C8J45_1251, partial [Sphingomonas sp. PP-CE-3G-477]
MPPQMLVLRLVKGHHSAIDISTFLLRLTALNARVMRRFGRSRRELFEEIDRPLLKALP